MMESYTHGSNEAMKALVEKIKNDPEHYDMSLNTEDMTRFIYAIRLACDLPYGEKDLHYGKSLGDWAGDMLSSIATTYGIEMI